MSKMIQVVVDSIRVNLMGPQRLVVLREANGDRYLPIWVGPFEAEAIALPLREIEINRPLTHDLLKNLFKLFEAPVQHVEITELRDDVFYGRIVARHRGQEISLDARPSDAIALALRLSVPILVAEEVLQEAGFHPEAPIDPQIDPAVQAQIDQMMAEVEEALASDSTEKETSSEKDRLSVFEDFLESLNLDDDEEEEDDAAP